MSTPTAVVQGRVAPLPVHRGDNATISPHAEGGSESAHAAAQATTRETQKGPNTIGATSALPRHPSTIGGETLKPAVR